jgi:UDP:flavonoid glycosyltransferase YjiC (YdhE family)
MDALLVPLGSTGDIHPFVGLGFALRERGHRVTVIGQSHAEPLVRSVALDFVPLDDSSRNTSKRNGLRSLMPWPIRRWRKLARASTVVPLVRPLYEILAERYVPGQTVVAASSLAFGARVAQEKLGLPLATVHLSPMQLRSVHRAPRQPNLFLPECLPPSCKMAAYWMLDKFVLDRLVAGPINAFRTELGLPPVRRFYAEWRHSPQRVIGLFPTWFGRPQCDWSAQTRLTGFPRYDESNLAPLPKEVEAFLTYGAPPVVFTAGSAVKECRRFFAESAAACQKLGCRGVLLTRFRDQLPTELPKDVRHFDYLPFSQVLPHAAALVHHGGIGTAAQALAAGIPQVVVPRKNDQPDNAARLESLGVAHALSPRAYRSSTVAQTLIDLLTSQQVAHRTETFRQRLADGDAMEQTCRLIEDLQPAEPLVVAKVAA